MKDKTIIWIALAFIGMLEALIFLLVMNILLILNPF